MKNVRINIKLEENLRKKYKSYCKKNNLILSKRIRQFIQMDLNGEIK